MSAYQRRLDAAIEGQSGASQAEAKRRAEEDERARREAERAGQSKKDEQRSYWADTLRRMFGM